MGDVLPPIVNRLSANAGTLLRLLVIRSCPASVWAAIWSQASCTFLRPFSPNDHSPAPCRLQAAAANRIAPLTTPAKYRMLSKKDRRFPLGKRARAAYTIFDSNERFPNSDRMISNIHASWAIRAADRRNSYAALAPCTKTKLLSLLIRQSATARWRANWR